MTEARAATALALEHEPQSVVYDEPTSALGHKMGARVMETLLELPIGDGRMLIIVTHDARIFGYADRIAHMDDGRIERIEKPSRYSLPFGSRRRERPGPRHRSP